MVKTPCDLTKPKIASYKNTWKRLQNILYLYNLKLAQEKDLHFYQTRSHAVVLYNTPPAACIEKAVCVKTQDELYQESATSCVKIELAMWSTRSTEPKRKIILGTIKRFTTVDLHNIWHENTGGALPKGSLDSKIPTSCSQIELVKWSTRSTKTRRKINQAIHRVAGKPGTASWTTEFLAYPFDSGTARYNT